MVYYSIDEPAPRRACQLCGQRSALSAPACAACLDELPWIGSACPGCALPVTVPGLCGRCQKQPRPWARAWSALRYDYPLRQQILRMKYGASFASIDLLAHAMNHALSRQLTALPSADAPPLVRPQLLLPVPLHWRRQWQRGYNQSAELARRIADAHDLPLAITGARRRRAQRDQIGLGARERRRNAQDLFAADARVVSGRHLALIDDVMTTGSTLEALTLACLAAGAQRVDVWTLARDL